MSERLGGLWGCVRRTGERWAVSGNRGRRGPGPPSRFEKWVRAYQR